ncbi:aspg [Pungitius sinensis]
MPDVMTRVLVIYTGGTIGMTLKDGKLVPTPDALVKALHKMPMLCDEEYTKVHLKDNTLALPLTKDNKRIVYTVLEYNPLLDSSNISPDDWAKIGKDIEKNYDNFEGFVILHGTDTMAYTASALSFMCEHLCKPIIVTGSQVPIYQLRNDGRDNLQGAVLIAGQYDIPEVCLYFYNQLFRGNRVTKVNAESFDAFTSPNLDPLAVAEADIIINKHIVRPPDHTEKFHVSTELNSNVGLLRLFPGITTATVKAFLQPPMKGVVLETYGCGNAPDNRADLLAALKWATDSGVIIMNVTQCLKGTVSDSYATGEALKEAGLIAGGDMTQEAALSKLSYVLAKGIDLSVKREWMGKNLRGEMSEVQKTKLSLSDGRFIRVIARCLSINDKEKLEAIREALTPPLACAAARIGDIEALKDTNSSLSDYDGRTPLHIAACEGHLKVVEYLLDHGVTISVTDRYGATPLGNAVRFRHKKVVRLLRKAGAQLFTDELDKAGTELCSLTASGDLEGLKMWELAGADLNQPGYNGQTPLELAHDLGKKEVVAFLKQLKKPK